MIEKLIRNMEQKIAKLPEEERIPLAGDLFQLKTLLGQAGPPAEPPGQPAFLQVSEILESITDAFYAVDASWRLTYANQHAARLFHKAREKLLGTLVWDVFPHHKHSETYPVVLYAMQERVPVNYETYSLTLKAWVEVYAYPSPDGGMLFYLRDVSERRRAIMQSLENERKFQAIFDSAPFAISLFRAEDNVIVDANPAWLRLFGFRREEVIGRSAPDLGVVLDPAERDRVITELKWKGSLRNHEMLYRAKNKRVLSLSVNTSPVSIEGVEYILSTIENITEYKNAEEQVRASEQKFHLVFNKMPFAIAIVKLPGGDLVEVNDAWERVFGWSREEALGKTGLDLGIFPDPETRARIQAQLKQGQPVQNLEANLRAKNGQCRGLLLNFDPFAMNGVRYLLCILIDLPQDEAPRGPAAIP